MANCKEIDIRGVMPFNTYEYETLNKMLGQLNAPIFGYRIEWTGSAPAVPTETGGQTAMYKFQISGMEAVSDFYFAHLVRAIREAGGTVTQLKGYDLGFDAGFGLRQIEATLKDLERYEAKQGKPLTHKEAAEIATKALASPDGDVWSDALIQIRDHSR
jgi:hypothetical protein